MEENITFGKCAVPQEAKSAYALLPQTGLLEPCILAFTGKSRFLCGDEEGVKINPTVIIHQYSSAGRLLERG